MKFRARDWDVQRVADEINFMVFNTNMTSSIVRSAPFQVSLHSLRSLKLDFRNTRSCSSS